MAFLILLYTIPDSYPQSFPFHVTSRDFNKCVATFFTKNTDVLKSTS